MGSPYTCESYDPTKIQLQKVPKMNLCANSPISWIGKFFPMPYDQCCTVVGYRRFTFFVLPGKILGIFV